MVEDKSSPRWERMALHRGWFRELTRIGKAALHPTPGGASVEWSEKERAAIADLMEAQDLSYGALLRQCVRYYQSDWAKRRDGETVVWSGDAARTAAFAGTDIIQQEKKS
jgi:hypothetical protein